MAQCTYTYKGKSYTETEFKKLLANGLLQELEDKRQIITNDRLPLTVKNKEDVVNVMQQIFLLNEEESVAVSAIMDARATTWSKENNLPKEDYYSRYGFDRTTLERLVKDNSLLQNEIEERNKIKEDAIDNGTFLKAPNGEPSNLEERDWITVRTKSFKDWFGKSKVVDENGEPKIQYHWSPTKGINKFNLSGIGSHFGTKAAADHVNSKKSGGTIKFFDEETGEDVIIEIPKEEGEFYPVFLKLDNPLYIRDKGQHTAERYGSEIVETLKDNGVNLSEEDINTLTNLKSPNNEAAGILNTILNKYGYDGFVYENEFEDEGSISYIVTEASDIKSIYNTGSFSKENDNIYYQNNDVNKVLAYFKLQPKSVGPISGFTTKNDKIGKDLYKRIYDWIKENNIPINVRWDMTHNVLQFRPTQGSLFQGPKAAIQFGDAMDIIYALTDSNVSSPVHELAHSFEKDLTDVEKQTVLEWTKDGSWTRETSEKFARGFEKYLSEGKAPFPELQEVFDKFKEWLIEIYNGITGSDIDLELNDSMRDLYAKLLGKEVVQQKQEITKPIYFVVPNRKASNYHKALKEIASFYKKGSYEEALSNYEITKEEVTDILKAAKYTQNQIDAVIWRSDYSNIESLNDIATWSLIPESYSNEYFIKVNEADKRGYIVDALEYGAISPEQVRAINDFLKANKESLSNTTLSKMSSLEEEQLDEDIVTQMNEDSEVGEILAEEDIEEVVEEEPIVEEVATESNLEPEIEETLDEEVEKTVQEIEKEIVERKSIAEKMSEESDSDLIEEEVITDDSASIGDIVKLGSTEYLVVSKDKDNWVRLIPRQFASMSNDRPIFKEGDEKILDSEKFMPESKIVKNIINKAKSEEDPAIKAKRETILRVAERMKKMFPSIKYKVGNYKGDFSGKFKNGIVYINLNNVDIDTPIHEFLHPFVYVLRIENNELYNNLIGELKTTSLGKKLIDDIKNDKNYNDISEKEQVDEALVRYLSSEIKEVFDENGFVIQDVLDKKRNNLIDFIKFVWSKLRELIFGSKSLPSLNKFIDRLNKSDLGKKYSFEIDDNLSKKESKVIFVNGNKPRIIFNTAHFKKGSGGYELGITTPEILFNDIRENLQSIVEVKEKFDSKKVILKPSEVFEEELESIFSELFEKKNVESSDLKEGLRVVHPTFGVGTVKSFDEKIVSIDFLNEDDLPLPKKLLIEKANLEFDISDKIEGDVSKYNIIRNDTGETVAEAIGYKKKGDSIKSYTLTFVDGSSLEGIIKADMQRIVSNYITLNGNAVTEFDQLIKISDDILVNKGRKSSKIAEYEEIRYNMDTGEVSVRGGLTKSGNKKDSDKKIGNFEDDSVFNFIGKYHYNLLKEKIDNNEFTEYVSDKTYRIVSVPIESDKLSISDDNNKFRTIGTIKPSNLPVTMTLQEVSDFLSVMENVEFDFKEHEDALSKLTYYQKVSTSANKKDVDELFKKISRKTDTLVDTAKRRLSGGSGTLIYESTQIKDLIDRYNSGEYNENKAIAEYIREGISALKIANSIFGEIKSNLGRDDLSQSEILDLNKKIKEATTLYAYYDKLGGIFSQYENLLTRDERKEFKETLGSVATMKNSINGTMLTLVSKWLYPKYKQQMSQYKNSKEIKESDILTEEQFRNQLRSSDSNISGISYLVGAAANSRDPIVAITQLAMVNAIQDNHNADEETFYRINVAYVDFLKRNNLQNNAKSLENFYKTTYLRKAKSWEQIDYDQDKKEAIYGYVDRWAFHTEYLEDVRDAERRAYIDKLNTSGLNEEVRKELLEKWNKENPLSNYTNPEFAKLSNDSFFKKLYQEYKNSNIKFGERKLNYGIIPQAKKKDVWINDAKNRIKYLREKVSKIDNTEGTTGLKASLSKAKNRGLALADELLSEDYYDNSYLNLDETDYRNIRADFLMPVEEADLDFSLNETVVAFSSDANRFNTLRETQAAAENLKMLLVGNPMLNIKPRSVVKTKKGEKVWDSVLKQPKVKRGLEAMSNKQIFDSINDIFYGETEKQAESTFLGGRLTINWNKVSDKLGFITALTNMTLNVPAFFRNVSIGNINTLGEAFGGKYYSKKDWVEASGEYSKNLPNFIADTERTIKSKVSQLAMRYDAIQGEFRDNFGRKVVGSAIDKMYNKNNLFFLNHAAEHQIQLTGMIALMKATKVSLKDGSQISLYDAYNADKDGVFKIREDAIWSPDNETTFRNTLHNISRSLNGNYSQMHKSVAQRYFIGKLMLQYRKYLYEQFRARYGSRRMDFELGDVKVGYYRRFFKKVLDEISDGVFTNVNKNYNDKWTELDKYSVKKTTYEIGMMTALASLAILLASAEGDDEDDLFLNYALLTSVGSYADLNMYSFGMIPEIMRQTKSPASTLYTAQKSLDFLYQLFSDPTAVYDKSGYGYDKGDNKLEVKLKKMIPIINQIRKSLSPEEQLQFYELTKRSPLGEEKSLTDRLVETIFKVK